MFYDYVSMSQDTKPYRHILLSAVVGVGAALVPGLLFARLVVVTFAPWGDRYLLFFLLIFSLLSAITGYRNGYALARGMTQSRLRLKLFLATPGVYLALALLIWASPAPIGWAAWGVSLGLIAVPSMFATTRGFHAGARMHGEHASLSCLECCYDLRGNVSGICPECGRPLSDEQGRAITGRSLEENQMASSDGCPRSD